MVGNANKEVSMKEIVVWRLLLRLLWDCSRESVYELLLQLVHTRVSIGRSLARLGTISVARGGNGLIDTNSTYSVRKILIATSLTFLILYFISGLITAYAVIVGFSHA
jgi:hypothetical protein